MFFQANDFVTANACNKLQMIAEQMRFLYKQAEEVLSETKQNMDLHYATCNFVKQPGNIYHLYQRESGQCYLSILSPEVCISILLLNQCRNCTISNFSLYFYIKRK